MAAVDFQPYRGKVDLVAGAPPCQPFSIGGVDGGHRDQRNLFEHAVRCVSECRPRAFLFENVAQLVTLDGGWRPINGDSSHEGSKAGGVLTAILGAFEAAEPICTGVGRRRAPRAVSVSVLFRAAENFWVS